MQRLAHNADSYDCLSLPHWEVKLKFFFTNVRTYVFVRLRRYVRTFFFHVRTESVRINILLIKQQNLTLTVSFALKLFWVTDSNNKLI